MSKTSGVRILWASSMAKALWVGAVVAFLVLLDENVLDIVARVRIRMAESPGWERLLRFLRTLGGTAFVTGMYGVSAGLSRAYCRAAIKSEPQWPRGLVEAGATVTDNSGEALSVAIAGTVDSSTAGTYIVTYDAADSSGNAAAQVTRTVIVGTAQAAIDDLIGTVQGLVDGGVGR